MCRVIKGGVLRLEEHCYFVTVFITMRIATWNVNSLRIRLQHVADWLAHAQPDVLLLQETKVEDALFPVQAFTQAGYYCTYHGQKSYNGVAIISRTPLNQVAMGLPDMPEPDQCRVIAATVTSPLGAPVRVISAYIPNGSEPNSPKFSYKEAFYRRLGDYTASQSSQFESLIVGGDFNIAADERDVDDPKKREKSVLFTPQERQWLADFQHHCGLSDALRLLSTDEKIFSWWDYRDLAFVKNRGMRIDYLFVTKNFSQKVMAVNHARDERKKTQPSDHVPVYADINI